MWKFREIGEGEPERLPRETEFFIGGDLDIPSSLVRETIQNSLDARQETPVRVRFTFISRKISEDCHFYKGLMEHLRACNLQDGGVSENERIQLLVAEDFNTIGLTGNIRRDQISGKVISNYYNFWWREGIAQKYGRHGGRWGLGKITFHIASKLRSFWGLTIRHDDNKALLLGKSLLKPHCYKERHFDYYGYFASERYRPIEDETILDDFRNRFGISRKTEPGLSVVIPMVVEEINTDAIIRAAIMHYFFPIVKGELIVEIRPENTSSVTINDSTLKEIARSQNWQGTLWQNRNIESLMDFVESVKDLENANNIIQLSSSGGSLRISENLFGDSLESFQNDFRAGRLLAFKIPVEIRPTSNSSKNSFFNVFVKKDEQINRADESYWRSGILIANIRMLGRQRVRALLSANDELVSRFLGDSETPAHADWNERTEGFKKRYTKAVMTLRFIKGSIREIVRILDIPPAGRESDFLKEIFHVKEPSKEPDRKGVRPPEELPPPKPLLFDVSKIQGGFRISLITPRVNLPIEVEITAAYDVRRGNPFKKYSPWDFDLSSMNRNISGGKELNVSKNKIRLKVDNLNFKLEVRGFDPKRDVIVRV